MGDAERLGRWQRTSQERLDTLIDAAAVVVDRVGLEGLTTTLVAQEAGASIGTVYRYFPDRIGVIEGLRQRGADVLHDRMHLALTRPFDGWVDVIAAVLATLVGAYREVRGFRAVTTHDWLGDGGSMTVACIGRLARQGLADGPSTTHREVPSERLVAAVRILDALTRSAFCASLEGDEALLQLARRHALDELAVATVAERIDPERLLAGAPRRWMP